MIDETQLLEQLKSEAHKNGLFHNTIHLWLYTKNGEILDTDDYREIRSYSKENKTKRSNLPSIVSGTDNFV